MSTLRRNVLESFEQSPAHVVHGGMHSYGVGGEGSKKPAQFLKPCRFGTSCTNPKCKYQHPLSRVNGKIEESFHRTTHQQAVRVCRYGNACFRKGKGCYFSHEDEVPLVPVEQYRTQQAEHIAVIRQDNGHAQFEEEHPQLGVVQPSGTTVDLGGFPTTGTILPVASADNHMFVPWSDGGDKSADVSLKHQLAKAEHRAKVAEEIALCLKVRAHILACDRKHAINPTAQHAHYNPV